jgi:hypothetical protein
VRPYAIWNIFKDFSRKRIPNQFWSLLANYKRKTIPHKFSEKIILKRNKGLPIFYVIRREPPGAGLFSNMNHVLQGLVEAEKRNLIPVVDMENYWTSYSLSTSIYGSENAWEYFFEQPTDHTLDNAYKSKQYVLSKGNRISQTHWLSNKNLDFVFDADKIMELNRLLSTYVHLNPLTKKTLEQIKSEIHFDPLRTLGISLRGTDYIEVEPHGHPRQPGISQIIETIRRVYDPKKYNKIFLACEDTEIRKEVEKQFKGLVHENFRQNSYFTAHVIAELGLSGRDLDKMVNSLGYLIEMWILSECSSCLASLANGSVISIGLNNLNFTPLELFRLGNY